MLLSVSYVCLGVCAGMWVISISLSLHTIALTREAKLWEDIRDCQGKGV